MSTKCVRPHQHVMRWEGIAEDLLPEIEQAILKFSETESSYGSTNVGGWKSRPNLFDRRGCMRQLGKIVMYVAQLAYLPSAWAMVNRCGSYHKIHTHGRGIRTGVYYVTSGDPAVPTTFVIDGEEQQVAPTPGRLVMFDGELPHYVPTYAGTSPRITVAFEVRR